MGADLIALPYHQAVASRLEAAEPRAWQLFTDAVRDDGPTPTSAEGIADESGASTDSLEAMLLRHAYRMEAGAHPRVHAAAGRAAEILGIDVPVVIYQLEGTERANASLSFRPGEAVLALSGNLLSLLDDDELAACFGHELAHYRLWTLDGRRYMAADRFLNALAFDAATPAVYLETARRFDLATELFADRGSLLVVGDILIAVSSLVKVATGLTDVDAQAFLRQAEAARPDRGADAQSHPETSLRAWALARWQAGDGEAGAQTLLAPTLDIEQLDMVDRERLEGLTRRLIMDVLAVDWMRSEAVVGHAAQFMVDAGPPVSIQKGRLGRSSLAVGAATAPVEARVPDRTPEATRRFLAYVLLDLATVDPDLDDEPLVECLAIARQVGIASTFEEVARRELSIKDRAWDTIRTRSAGRRLTADPSPGRIIEATS